MESREGDSSVKSSVGWGHPSVDLGTTHPATLNLSPPPGSPLLDLPQPPLLLYYLPMLSLHVACEHP